MPPVRLRAIRLNNFTVFDTLRIELVDGINVFIGPNASGKTHLLKAAYALLSVCNTPESMMRSLTQKLSEVFLPADDQLSRLARLGTVGSAEVSLEIAQGEAGFQLGPDGRVAATRGVPGEAVPVLFLPARDVLGMYEGFSPLYTKFKVPFDRSYFDACIALGLPVLREGPLPALATLVASLEEALGGRVELRGNRFYVRRADGHDIEAHLLAEGHRKLATLAQLIRNGSIAPGTILFWDEPESNLNPKLIQPMAHTLRLLADAGVQVLLATHDYLLSHELSLAAEYGVQPEVPMRFFSLYREHEPDGPVRAEHGDTLVDIDRNPILEEHAAIHDRERALMREREDSG